VPHPEPNPPERLCRGAGASLRRAST
jgi:hypothetical protein